MNDYVLYYTTLDGTKDYLRFSLGDEYECVDDFVEEFKWDHPNLFVTSVEEDRYFPS